MYHLLTPQYGGGSGRMQQHAQHHSRKHMQVMKKAMNRGESFKSSHKLAMDQVGAGEKRKRTTVKDMLNDLYFAMGDFQRDGPFEVDYDSAHYFSRSIELACNRILEFNRDVWDDAAEEASVFTDQDFDEDERIPELTRILKRFTPLASIWGYDYTGHDHTNFEDKIHKDSEIYGCIYPTTDIVFRNLARIAAGKPLILSDGVQGINGKIKWRNENFDHCFDEVGDKVDRLLSDFLQQNEEQEGGRNAARWY